MGQVGVQPGQLARPSGVATDPEGNVFVADTDDGRIQKFDPAGRLLEVFDVPNEHGSVYVFGEASAASVASGRLRYRSGRIAVTVACGPSGTCRAALRRSGKHRVTVQLRQRGGGTVSRKLTLRT